MRERSFAVIVIATGTLLTSILPATLQATTEGPSISVDSAIQVAQSVVSGRFTGDSETHLWVYEDALNDRGQVEQVTEVMTAYEFSIDETLHGERIGGTVRINIPGGRHNGYETPKRQKLPELGVAVVIGVNADRAAKRRGFDGFNLVHGKVVPVTEATPLEQIKAKVLKIREPSSVPNFLEAQTESMEKSLIGVNFDNEYVSTEQSDTGDIPPDDLTVAQGTRTDSIAPTRSIDVSAVADKAKLASILASTSSTVQASSPDPTLLSVNDGPTGSPTLRQSVLTLGFAILLTMTLFVITTVWRRRRVVTEARA